MTHAIIIGSTRCGTTSAYNYLGAHPSIEMAKTLKRGAKGRREVHFFDYEHHYERGTDWYWQQFKDSPVTLETSPTMLQHLLAPERLKETIPDCRVIVLMRNPVDRAYSNYWLARRKGHTTRTFENDIYGESRRLRWELETDGFWENHFYLSEHHLSGYLERGLYAKHLKRWLEFFPKEQMRVIKSESLFAYPIVAIGVLWDWLGLEQAPMPKLRQWQHVEYEAMARDTRKWLEQYYEVPNRELQEMVKWTW